MVDTRLLGADFVSWETRVTKIALRPCKHSFFYHHYRHVHHQCPEMGTSSIDWAQLSRFHLKTETECSFRNVVF
jgi:hypothetical protein